MICLLACGAATIGSRWWLLAAAAQRRLSAASAYIPIALTAILGSGLSALLGATLHAQVRGPGMLLLLAIALLFAGLALAWPARPISAKLSASVKGPLSALILLSAAMLSDSAPFIIMATVARTGNMTYAGVGGAIGLIAAAVGTAMIDPTEPLPAWLNWLRRAIAVILCFVAVIAAASARGLL
ncbi:MAG: hypothetical protein ABL909_04565 [Sphingopyxis sp.]